MTRRFVGLLAAAGVQLVALALAHELVFLARYGSRYGEALVHSGHGQTWSAAVTTSIALGVFLAVVAAARLVRLRVLLRRTAARTRSMEPAFTLQPLLRAWLRIGLRLAFLSVALLTVQENLERAAISGVMPGPAILLTPEYAGGLWITIVVGLAVGLVAALFEWRRNVLTARLRAARSPLPRATSAPAKRAGVLVEQPRESLIGRRSALRAPPAVVAV
jgi:hypothetical protein